MFYLFTRSSGHQSEISDIIDQASVKQKVGLPKQINITSLNIEAPVQHVAIAPDGSMDVPTTATSTAWYNLGPRPGEIGSAVIDGHVDWKDGTKAVFADLHKLQIGDKITVSDEQGKVISFIVRRTHAYNANANATEIFRSNDGLAHLNLITCSGVWDKASQNYAERFVVFADKEH